MEILTTVGITVFVYLVGRFIYLGMRQKDQELRERPEPETKAPTDRKGQSDSYYKSLITEALYHAFPDAFTGRPITFDEIETFLKHLNN
jgi:hypothetical protein